MADSDRQMNESTADSTPAAVPWLQALGLVMAGIVRALDVYGPSEFQAEWWLYLLFGSAVISLGPEQAIRLIEAVTKLVRGK